jgi:hypothetical protein
VTRHPGAGHRFLVTGSTRSFAASVPAGAFFEVVGVDGMGEVAGRRGALAVEGTVGVVAVRLPRVSRPAFTAGCPAGTLLR